MCRAALVLESLGRMQYVCEGQKMRKFEMIMNGDGDEPMVTGFKPRSVSLKHHYRDRQGYCRLAKSLSDRTG